MERDARERLQREGCLFCLGTWKDKFFFFFFVSKQGAWIGLDGRKGKERKIRVLLRVSAQRARETRPKEA